MTTVSHGVQRIDRHTFDAPCTYSPYGDGYTTVIGEFATAWDMAVATAKELGINTSCDDWANVRPSDEKITIFFDVIKPPPF